MCLRTTEAAEYAQRIRVAVGSYVDNANASPACRQHAKHYARCSGRGCGMIVFFDAVSERGNCQPLLASVQFVLGFKSLKVKTHTTQSKLKSFSNSLKESIKVSAKRHLLLSFVLSVFHSGL